MTISSECLALVAAICVNENSRIEVTSNALWGGAVIEISAARIKSIVRTDAHVYPDRSRMARLCIGNDCLSYHLYCAAQGDEFFCRISYAEQGDLFSKRIEIYARDEESMQAIFGRLRIAGFRRGTLFPLSGFRVRSLTSYPPYCRPREDVGCN